MAPVWGVMKGWWNWAAWTHSQRQRFCCWSPTWPYRYPAFTEMTRFSRYERGGLLLPPAPAAKPVQGADGAHLERAISAKAKPISELITSTLCECWGFPGDGGDGAALRSPSAAAGAACAAGAGGPGAAVGAEPPSLGTTRLQNPSAEPLGAVQILSRSYPCVSLRFSWLCLPRRIHLQRARYDALHEPVAALTVKI